MSMKNRFETFFQSKSRSKSIILAGIILNFSALLSAVLLGTNDLMITVLSGPIVLVMAFLLTTPEYSIIQISGPLSLGLFLAFLTAMAGGLLHAVPVTLGSVGCTACGIATARILLLRKNPNKTNSDKTQP